MSAQTSGTFSLQLPPLQDIISTTLAAPGSVALVLASGGKMSNKLGQKVLRENHEVAFTSFTQNENEQDNSIYDRMSEQ